MRKDRRISAWSVAAALAVAIALGATGCARRALPSAGNLAMEMYKERNVTSLPPAEPEAAPPAAPDAAPQAAPPAAVPGALPKKPPLRLAGFIDPLTKSGDRVPVTLEGCLRRTLAGNLAVQIARFGPAVTGAVVAEAEAIFDPSWFMNNALNRVRREAPTILLGAQTLSAKQWDFSTGIDALLPTGGTVAVSQDWLFQNSNSQFLMPNPQYDSSIGVALRQPLLRGAGTEVTKSPIVIANMDHEISQAEFHIRVMDALLLVERTYWELVVAEVQVQALTEALDAAKENLRIARRRFEEGKDKRVIVSLAESAATSREADLVAAKVLLARTSDRLKRLINDPHLPLEDPVLLEPTEWPMNTPMPVTRQTHHSSMIAAMHSRPEMVQADLRLRQAGVHERVARNQRLPQLDLATTYAFLGLDSDVDRAANEQFETRFYQWSVGLEFRVPIGNRARAAAHERTKLIQERLLHEREDVRQRVLLDVSEAVRILASAQETILATRAARIASEQSLKDQEANVSAGAALVKDLLDAQRDLANAKVREINALTIYMVSLAQLERAKGTLLEYNNISIVHPEP